MFRKRRCCNPLLYCCSLLVLNVLASIAGTGDVFVVLEEQQSLKKGGSKDIYLYGIGTVIISYTYQNYLPFLITFAPPSFCC
jgi:hypothetical protein